MNISREKDKRYKISKLAKIRNRHFTIFQKNDMLKTWTSFWKEGACDIRFDIFWKIASAKQGLFSVLW